MAGKYVAITKLNLGLGLSDFDSTTVCSCTCEFKSVLDCFRICFCEVGGIISEEV